MTLKDFFANHGSTLITRFASSPSQALSHVYKDFEFLPWKFPKLSRGYFDDIDNRRKYLDWLRAEVGVNSYTDLTTNHFLENCGYKLLKAYRSSPKQIIESISETDSAEKASDTLRRARKPHKFYVLLILFKFFYCYNPFPHFVVISHIELVDGGPA